MKPFKLVTSFIFATLILFSLSLAPSVFAHPEEFHTDESEVTSSASSSSSSKSQSSSKLVPNQGELCQNDSGCPVTGTSNLPSIDSEINTETSINSITFNIIRFVSYILIALSFLAFIPLTITGIVLLVNKQNKFWSIFCLAISPTLFILSIIIFTIVNIAQQAVLS
jgi:hypothetical protein